MHGWLGEVLVPDLQLLGRYCMKDLAIYRYVHTYYVHILYVVFLITENESRQAKPVPANGRSAKAKV